MWESFHLGRRGKLIGSTTSCSWVGAAVVAPGGGDVRKGLRQEAEHDTTTEWLLAGQANKHTSRRCSSLCSFVRRAELSFRHSPIIANALMGHGFSVPKTSSAFTLNGWYYMWTFPSVCSAQHSSLKPTVQLTVKTKHLFKGFLTCFGCENTIKRGSTKGNTLLEICTPDTRISMYQTYNKRISRENWSNFSLTSDRFQHNIKKCLLDIPN